MTKPESFAQMLAEAPRDAWVALSEDELRVVGSGSTMEEAVSAAAQQGVAEPILVKAPKQWGYKALQKTLTVADLLQTLSTRQAFTSISERIHWWPMLSVRLADRRLRLRTKAFYAVVDSGSSACLFHADFLKPLGMKLEDGIEDSMGGVGKGARIPVFYHDVQILVGADSVIGARADSARSFPWLAFSGGSDFSIVFG